MVLIRVSELCTSTYDRDAGTEESAGSATPDFQIHKLEPTYLVTFLNALLLNIALLAKNCSGVPVRFIQR